MEYKKKMADNLIKEIELNEYNTLFEKWEKMKDDLLYFANSSLEEESFWDYIKYISEEIGNKIRK
mgnify:CR=1 FL=1